jgi:hypothetical protein
MGLASGADFISEKVDQEVLVSFELGWNMFTVVAKLMQ